MKIEKEERELRLDNAACELVDEIWPITDKLEKINLLLGDVMEEFFDQYDPEDEKDASRMACQFKRYRLLADISHELAWERKYQERKTESKIKN